MDNDLKWNSHVDYIIKKACEKLYSLRVLRRTKVFQPNMLRIYLGSVRPVLEYAVPVWQDIPTYLSEAIARVQKRALNIIYSEAESYAHALQLGNLDKLDDRRVHFCYKYMAKMKPPSHPLHHTPGRAQLSLKAENTKVLSLLEHAGLQDLESRKLFTFKYFM